MGACSSKNAVKKAPSDDSSCVHKWKFHGAFVLNRRVDIHAVDVKPAR